MLAPPSPGRRRRLRAPVLLASLGVALAAAPAFAQEVDDALSALDRATRALARRAAPAVVRVDAERILSLRVVGEPGAERTRLEDLLRRSTAREAVTASGFVVDAGDLVVTTTAVVDARSHFIRVTFAGGTVRDGHLVGTDSLAGVAVVRILPVDGVTPLSLGSATPESGALGVLLGRALDETPTLQLGLISAVNREVGDYDAYFFAGVTLRPGDAGAPLLDPRGNVLGMSAPVQPEESAEQALQTLDLMARYEDAAAEPVPTFVPARELARIVVALRDTGTVKRGLAGVFMDAAEDEPPLVTRVAEDLPAAKAGVQPGDTVVAVDGNPVRTVRRLVRFVQRRAPGTQVALTLRDGDGALRTVELVLAEFPQRDVAPPAWFNGIGVTNIDQEGATALEIRSIEPGSTGSVCGLRPGDRIVSVAGRPVSNEDDYTAIATLPHGEARSMPVEVLREGKRLTILLK